MGEERSVRHCSAGFRRRYGAGFRSNRCLCSRRSSLARREARLVGGRDTGLDRVQTGAAESKARVTEMQWGGWRESSWQCFDSDPSYLSR